MIKLFPPRQNFPKILTLPAIRSGNDIGIGIVKLIWARKRADADTVTYKMTPAAAKLYKFNEARPVSFIVGGVDRTQAISWDLEPSQITITVNPDDTAWESGKATFYFLGINGTPNPPDFDPTILNSGGPRSVSSN
ncbi:hypothetical protein [Nevskia ramosa]|uniref:hypothetical protein n=1 Tax=Nevskia ramosa TaxID=64002 RepID=UPI00235231B0|nr:hypothetical protein [Nevskia ramosa]